MFTHLVFWLWLMVAVTTTQVLAPRRRTPALALLCLSFLAWYHPLLTAGYLTSALALWWTLERQARGPSQRPDPFRQRLRWGVIIGLALALAATKWVPTAVLQVSWQQAHDRGWVPLGISYLVFKLIHLVVESNRGQISRPPLADYLTWLFLVPSFTAGPIERWDHFRNHQAPLDSTAWAEALTRLMHAVVKKYLLAETLLHQWIIGSGLQHSVVAESHLVPVPTLWFFIAASYLKIYLDFSAYSDFALATARLLGIRLTENFNWPILARNTSDFWRRWHISLSAWCQHYVYMPSLAQWRNPLVALLLSFLVMGLWHVASWNRVGWAVYSTTGVLGFLLWSRWLGRPPPHSWRTHPAWTVTSVALTQIVVVGSYAFLANGEDQSLRTSLTLLARLFGWTIPTV